MGLNNQKQVQAAMDMNAGRAVKRMARQFNRDIGPLIEAIKKGKSFAGVERSLGVTTLKRMGTDSLTETLAVEGTKASLAGRTSGKVRRLEITRLEIGD